MTPIDDVCIAGQTHDIVETLNSTVTIKYMFPLDSYPLNGIVPS